MLIWQAGPMNMIRSIGFSGFARKQVPEKFRLFKNEPGTKAHRGCFKTYFFNDV
jgi:hypothetical protein